jgi:hypothetical protein
MSKRQRPGVAGFTNRFLFLLRTNLFWRPRALIVEKINQLFAGILFAVYTDISLTTRWFICAYNIEWLDPMSRRIDPYPCITIEGQNFIQALKGQGLGDFMPLP